MGFFNFGKKEGINQPNVVEVKKDGYDVTFLIPETKTAEKGSLQCQLNEKEGRFVARTLIVKEKFHRQGLAEKMFIAAIDYARKNNLQFATDHGVSAAANALIEKLISQGYHFVKNPNVLEKETELGKRYVTPDGSPLYILE